MSLKQTILVQHQDDKIQLQHIREATQYQVEIPGCHLIRVGEGNKSNICPSSSGDDQNLIPITCSDWPSLITWGVPMHLGESTHFALFNLDKLMVGIDFVQKALTIDPLIATLQHLKSIAKKEPVHLEVGGKRFQVLPYGRKSWYPYGLICDDYLLFFSSIPSGSHCQVMLEMSPRFLWRHGYLKAWSDFLDWLKSMDWEVSSTKVSRCDLSLHTDAIPFQDLSLSQFASVARNRNERHDGDAISGFEWGKGDLHTIIYNKSHYIRKHLKDQWFTDVWKNHGWTGKRDIWNIEYQLKAKYMRRQNIYSVEDVFCAIPRLWRYLTSQWLILKEGNHSRINRRQPSPIWQEIVAIAESLPNYYVTQNTTIIPSIDVLGQLASITGSCLSLAKKANIKSLEDLMQVLKRSINDRLISEGKTFEEYIQDAAISYP